MPKIIQGDLLHMQSDGDDNNNKNNNSHHIFIINPWKEFCQMEMEFCNDFSLQELLILYLSNCLLQLVSEYSYDCGL